MSNLNKKRFNFDPESGYIWDNENKNWLTTAEEVFLAMIEK